MLRRRQIRAIKRAFRKLFKQTWNSVTTVSKSVFDWFLRTILLIGVSKQQQAHGKAGFVLPTVVMLLLVVSLVVGAILLRTGSRTNQVIGAREEQIIFNAATPAVERARSKLEYLFLKDKRKPSGAPSDEMLLSILTNNANLYNPPLFAKGLDDQSYKLPDETELGDINNDGSPDPAWSYQVDTDGDGTKETVVYSILFKRRNDITSSITLENSTDLNKAKALVVRNGPINNIASTGNPICDKLNQSPPNNNSGSQIQSVRNADWFSAGSGTLRKTFQVDAIVISNKAGSSRTVATLEFQQDREIKLANTGAWFRYDLEIFPGNAFRWNGSMYTAGNLIVGGPGGQFFRSYLISSPNSCFYDSKFPGASEITIYENDQDPKNPDFQGQVLSGSYQTGGFGTNSSFDVLKDDGSPNTDLAQTTLDTSKDSVTQNKSFAGTAVDPVKLLTEDKVQAKLAQFSNRDTRDSGWDADADPGKIGYFRTRKRIYNLAGQVPFIDDSYRADDRYGPKPTYGREKDVVVSPGQMGQNIPASQTQLVSNTINPLDTDFINLGWDGYWERRAWAAGLRLIVGQRLELGNPFGFDPTSDPLLPPAPGQTLTHEAQQRRTLRDNLAAVQGTAVYHVNSSAGQNVPIACVATTAHPGTTVSTANSTNFKLAGDKYSYPGQTAPLFSDFFTGLGTNGWEFEVPTSIASNGTLSGGAMQNALKNLANFAGDPDGAFPPKQGGGVHPDPTITMWGDFSNLRRALNNSNSSIADNSYLHTAACTMGMLAYNIRHFENYNYANDLTNINNLETELRKLLDGDTTNGEVSPTSSSDEFIRELRNRIGATNPNLVRVAELVALKQQIIKDRDANPVTPTPIKYDHDSNAATPDITVQSACVPATFPGVTNPAGLTRLCPTNPKFPILSTILPLPGTSLDQIAINPRPRDQWRLPRQDDPPANPANQNHFVVIDPNGTTRIRTSLGDTGFFNGREMMTVRALDIDLDLLRRNTVNSDFWLPNSGIVYAFREDAVREDAIARTASGTETNATDTNLPNGPKDPALVNGVSPKPVDFVADPYRRPYGFRLRNGQNIRRNVDNLKGLSFVSDNPVYIQGDFNFHSTDGNSNNLEEFTDPLSLDDWSNFYTRQTLDERFARPSTDTWRPSEILADAITILSRNFQEGNIASGIQDDTSLASTRPGLANGRYSFRSMNGPTSQPARWLLEDGTVSRNGVNAANLPVPIKVDRNGTPMVCSTAPADPTAISGLSAENQPRAVCPVPTAYSGGYRTFSSDYRSVISVANETRVNAMIISGIVPSRENQSYGGFHNFPRFIESWNNGSKVNMIISGSFVQLNFSTYATAPFTRTAWEPGDTPKTDNPTDPQFILYYGPPGRRWGYDVGLQYAPAGPIAQRLVLPASSRSEFYRDLEANDPYICRLRLALNRLNGQDPVAQKECQ